MAEEKKREVKSVILDSELPEWEEWANRVFGHQTEKREPRRNDWDNRKNQDKKKR
jgi:hypothetical protein